MSSPTQHNMKKNRQRKHRIFNSRWQNISPVLITYGTGTTVFDFKEGIKTITNPLMPTDLHNLGFSKVEESSEEGQCRVCGCTDSNPCIHSEMGECTWVQPDLCSHCLECPGQSVKRDEAILEDNIYDTADYDY